MLWLINNEIDFEISAPKSPEREYLSLLFLNKIQSDISFKFGDSLIPAHKQVLAKNSQSFAHLINSKNKLCQYIINDFQGKALESIESIDINYLQDYEFDVFIGRVKVYGLFFSIE